MLSKKIYDYTKKEKELFLPYLYTKWGVEPSDFTDALCQIWHKFENPRMVGNLLHTNKEEQPDLYETCRSKYKRGNSIVKQDYWKYCKINQSEDQHISVFSHDEAWKENFAKTGSVSCRDTTLGMDYLYLELDRETLKKACEDALKFYLDFPFKEYCSLWFSGNKSIHIQIDASLFGKPMGDQSNIAGRGKLAYNLAHKMIGDIRHDNGLVDPWMLTGKQIKEKWEELYEEDTDHKDAHEMKQYLENVDPNLYTTNSLIRQPYSFHETGKKQKVEIPVEQLIFGTPKESKKKIDIGRKNSYINTVRTPYLIHWVYECYQLKRKPKHNIPDVDEGEIINTFQKVFEYFDAEEANPEGWVNGLFSPFYEDTNNSVSVNIKTGYYHDFGHGSHSLNFKQFKEKINEQEDIEPNRD